MQVEAIKWASGISKAVGVAVFSAAVLLASNNASAQLVYGGQYSLADPFGITLQDDAWFGAALASGDFNCDGLDDLATGAPHWDKGSIEDAGIVTIQYATADGLDGGDSQWIHQDIGGVPGVPESHDNLGSSLASGDFNDDGCADLAIGLPGQNIDGTPFSALGGGMVIVVYGDAGGLDPLTGEYFHQDVSGIPGDAESFDYFGIDLAAGDLDGDGWDDLAVGVFGEDIEAGGADLSAAGCVVIIPGAASGLVATSSHDICAGTHGLPPAQENELFGVTLAIGDVYPQHDGEELVVGHTGRQVSGNDGAGMVSVLFGDGSPALSFTQDSPGIAGVAEADDYFGSSLALGDFDGDGYLDVAASAVYEDFGNPVVEDAGAVIVMSLGPSSADTSRSWVRSDLVSLGEQNYRNDRFGRALASGDINNDGIDDLAIGAPAEGLPLSTGESWVGATFVLYGREDDLLSDQGAQNLPMCFAVCEWGTHWGGSVVAGDFDIFPGMEVAVGARNKTVENLENAGMTRVFYYNDTIFRDGFEAN